MIVLYVHCSSTHALPINLILCNLEGSLLWFLAYNCLFMVDLILILIIVFSTLSWMLTMFCILLMDVLNAE
jgi:hypothetical protein